MAEKKMFIGLDIGSNSIGWAVTDENYRLWRLKGKTAWGARLFDEAETSKARREFRSSKRRANRRKYRIQLLNQLFAEQIGRMDPTFFLRLSQSNLQFIDRDQDAQCRCPIFKSERKEKEYYQHFPTIYHLRKALMRNEEYAFSDVRYLYLALHHIMKYRGNFLLEGAFDPDSSIDAGVFATINQTFSNLMNRDHDEEEAFEIIPFEKQKDVTDILLNADFNKTKKKSSLKRLIEIKTEDKLVSAYIDLLISLIVGGEFSLKKICPNLERNMTVSLHQFDEQEEEIRKCVGDYMPIVYSAKSIYDYVLIHTLLGRHTYLSDAYIDVYEKHKMQLQQLKKAIQYVDKVKKFSHKEKLYYRIFQKEDCIYASLHGANLKEFNDQLKKELSPYEDIFGDYSDYSSIKNLIDNGEFLKTIAHFSTSSIPHQLHQIELELILENAKKHFDFVDDAFMEKVVKLFTFRVPYYYGPLGSTGLDKQPHAWAVKKEEKRFEKVTPWNFDACFDDGKTREQFIRRMTKKCSYLLDEDVLPKCSILFQQYVIFNRLATMTINGKIDAQKNLEIYHNLILKKEKTSVSQIKKYLHKVDDGEVMIGGLNESDDFINTSFIQFKNLFGDLSNEKNLNMAENCIFYLTIYSDSPKDAVKVIVEQYPQLKQDKMKKALQSIKCTGWASLSRKVLCGIKVDVGDGMPHSIMSLLSTLQYGNFMKILNDPVFHFQTFIEEHNQEFMDRNGWTKRNRIEEILENVPALTRRSVIQTMRIVDEVCKIAKRTPDYISVEVTRSNKSKKEEKSSRTKEVDSFLKSLMSDAQLGDIASDLKQDLQKQLQKNHLALKGKHVYLYFKQLGYDMYTGEKIDLDEVIQGKYDIDHIIPQSKIKDDSLDNMVLVQKDFNQKIKKDIYPLSHVITDENYKKMVKIWTLLYKKGAISKEKFARLTRTTDISDEELSDFVNRQINVVDYANKALIDILKIKYPRTTILFSKAQYPAFIRKSLEIAKLRELNDTHHAVDAYLNVFCGVMLYERYSQEYYIQHGESKIRINEEGQKEYSYNMEKYLFYRTHQKQENGAYPLSDLGNLIRTTSLRHDFLLTYRNTYYDSQFYDMNIVKANPKSSALYPIHTNIPAFAKTDQYGGYNNISVSYFVIGIENGKKKILDVPTLLATQNISQEERERKLREMYSIPNGCQIDWSKIIIPGQKIEVAGMRYLLSNFNRKYISLKPIDAIFLPNDEALYLQKAFKKIEDMKSCVEDYYPLQVNKDGEIAIMATKERNLAIYHQLIQIAGQKKYDFSSMISKNRSRYSDVDFMEFSLYEELIEIRNMMYLMGRNSTQSTTTPNNMLPTKAGFIAKNEVYLICDSITGLYSQRIKI